MGISIDTFRALAAQANLGDNKDVFVSGVDKSALATRRDAGGRALSAREVKLAQTQDNMYLRGQLLGAVRDALGGENNNVFRNLQKMLFGITAENPGGDLEIASKPLKMRTVRAALEAVAIRQEQRVVEQQFHARIDATFSELNISPRNIALIRGVLTKAMCHAQNVDHHVTLATLTGPGSAFAMLQEVAAQPTGLMRTVLIAQSLPARQIVPYLKACAVFGPNAINYGLDRRLHAVMDQVAALPAKKFTPYNLFKLACPDCTWPRDLAKNAPLQGSVAESQAFENAISKGMLPDLGRRFDDAEPEEAARLGGLLSSLNVMFDLGMKAEDVAQVVRDPKTFRMDMLPPIALRVGDMGPSQDLDEAFAQLMRDVLRTSPKIEIAGATARDDWSASAAISLETHPLHAQAERDLRAHIDALCGPNATDVLKSNVYLSMSQNAQAVDGVFNQLLGLGAVGAAGIKFVLSAGEDGSVLVSRRAALRSRYEIAMDVRFFPDGSQQLEQAPTVRLRADMPLAEVTARREEYMRQLANTAKSELSSQLGRTDATTFAALFDAEIASMKAAYPTVPLTTEQYRMRAGNIFCSYLADPANAKVATDLLALEGEARAAKIAEIKATLQQRVELFLAAYVLGVKAEQDAEAQIRAAAGNPPAGHKVDLARLREKISYCTWAEDATKADVETQINAVRDAFVNERRAVFDFARALPDGEAFREQLVLDTMERAHLKPADVAFAVDLAHRVPVPAANVALDRAGARQALMDFGASLASVYLTLDPANYGGEQRGSITSLVTLYLLEERRDAMQNLISRLTPADFDALDASFANGFNEVGRHAPGSSGYVNAMAQTYASALLLNLRQAFNV